MRLLITLAALLMVAAPAGVWAVTNTLSSSAEPPPVAGAGDWPMYGHDQSRTNFNAAETAINRSTVGSLQQLWQVNVGSNGVAPSGAPSVANGTVYVASSVDGSPNFFAFDAASGARVWAANIGHIEVGCFNIGVGATPAVSGGLVVAGGGDAAYYGLDAATGAQRWRHPLNVGSSGFPWASPLIVGSRVYLGVSSRCDNPSVRGELRAVDLASGAQQANVYFAPPGVAGAGIWNSPALTPDGQTLVVATGEDYLGANGPYTRAMVTLDPTNLQIRQVDQEGATSRDLDFGSTPVIFHDAGGRLLVGANHKNGVFYAYVLNNVNAGPLWSRGTGTSVGMMPAYDPTLGSGGTLFIAASGQIYAVDPATGKDRWAPVSVGTMHGNLAVVPGLIFANAGSEGVQVLDEATGARLRTLTPPGAGPANSGPVVANGIVYWLSGDRLNAWGLRAPAPAPTATGLPGFADPAFSRLWTRTDSLVASHAAPRSWLWGPAPNTKGLSEPYAEGQGGVRKVQYFDKSRMEINNPNADPNGPFYVTNGLLVVELISGRMQVGNNAYQARQSAVINIAGDTNDAQAPTYKSFLGVSNTTLGDHKVPNRTGQIATATLTRAGVVGNDTTKSRYSGLDFVHYEAGVGHNIPRIFWDFLNQQGPVVENGQVVQAPLSTPWFYASGLPISEPYWATVRIAGTPRDVLIQAFERRVLTYTPANSDPFRVEMGNVGQHYYSWRYGTAGSQALALPTGTAAPETTPTATRSGQVEAVASGFGSPDDLLVAPSGDIIFGDFGNNALDIIHNSGSPRPLASGLSAPEGLVWTNDGFIVVAEQGTNRILEINPQTGKSRLLRQMVNNTGQDGVDGLGIDPATGDILVPDSPNGRLLRMSRDGSTLQTIATGFVRPTGAAVEAIGSIVVADEFGNAVYRLQPNGTRTRLAGIFQPDDVIVGPDGSIYANSLGGDIVRIDPVTRATKVLMSGLKLPHGLGIDSSGRLVIAEAGRNRILRLAP